MILITLMGDLRVLTLEATCDMHNSAYIRCHILHMLGAGKAAALLKILGDERRLRLIRLLLIKRELCVCELVDALQLPQYEVSRNLGALRKAGLVDDRRDGLWAYYFIPETAHRDPFIGELLKLIRDQVTGPKLLASDLVRLQDRLSLRVGDQCVVGFRS